MNRVMLCEKGFDDKKKKKVSTRSACVVHAGKPLSKLFGINQLSVYL